MQSNCFCLHSYHVNCMSIFSHFNHLIVYRHIIKLSRSNYGLSEYLWASYSLSWELFVFIVVQHSVEGALKEVGQLIVMQITAEYSVRRGYATNAAQAQTTLRSMSATFKLLFLSNSWEEMFSHIHKFILYMIFYYKVDYSQPGSINIRPFLAVRWVFICNTCRSQYVFVSSSVAHVA